MPTRIRQQGNKPTEAELLSRHADVLHLLISGFNRAEILSICCKKFSVSVRTIDYYLAAANKVLKENAAVDREKELGLALQRFNEIYKRSMSMGELKTALASNKELAALLGLNKVLVHFIGKVHHDHSVTGEDAERIFDILEATGILTAPADAAEAD